MTKPTRTAVFIDPPSGWKYGFPKELPPDKKAEDLLRESGYPEKDIEFALQYCRHWEEPMSEIALALAPRKKKASFKVSDVADTIKYNTVTRECVVIRRFIDRLYKKIHKVHAERGMRPTHVVMNELDYQFIRGYLFHHGGYSLTHTAELKARTIFGLKIILTTAKRCTVGWE